LPIEVFANPSQEYIFINLDKSPILLRSTKNPYGPSPLARIAMTKSVNSTNRYAWNLYPELISRLLPKRTMFRDNNILLGAANRNFRFGSFYTALQKGNFIIAENTYNLLD